MPTATVINPPTPEELQRLTQEANEFMESSGRKIFPPVMVDELFEQGARRCFKCRTVKPLDQFHKNRRNRHGLTSECGDCGRSKGQQWHNENRDSELERMRRWYRDNREHARERSAEWSEENPDYHRETHRLQKQLNDGYRRAVRAGAEAERITQAEMEEYWTSIGLDPLVSAFSGAPLTRRNRSVDHIRPISEGGSHTKENLAPCTWEENSSKHKGHFIHLLGKVHTNNEDKEG